MDYFNYEYGGGAIDNYTFLGTGNHSWKDYTAQGESWDLVFKDDNGIQKVDAVGNTGNFQPYLVRCPQQGVDVAGLLLARHWCSRDATRSLDVPRI